MDILRTTCTFCGCSFEASMFLTDIAKCPHCGTVYSVKRDAQPVSLTLIQKGRPLTQSELERIQQEQELYSVQQKLRNVQSELRSLEKDIDLTANRARIIGLRRQENDLKQRFLRLQNALVTARVRR